MTETIERNARKLRRGVVVSDTQDKTIVVTVERRTTDPLYGKTVKRNKRYHVHDENNESGLGDRVEIVESRPRSKTKRWEVIAQ